MGSMIEADRVGNACNDKTQVVCGCINWRMQRCFIACSCSNKIEVKLFYKAILLYAHIFFNLQITNQTSMDNESKNIKIAELASENLILKYGSHNALQELSNAYEEYIFNLLLVSEVFQDLPSRDRINQFKTKHDKK